MFANQTAVFALAVCITVLTGKVTNCALTFFKVMNTNKLTLCTLVVYKIVLTLEGTLLTDSVSEGVSTYIATGCALTIFIGMGADR